MKPSKRVLTIAALGTLAWILDGLLRPVEWVWRKWPR